MKKIVLASMTVAALAACGANQTKSGETSMHHATGKHDLKGPAHSAFLALFRDYSEDDVRKYIDAGLIQHNPFVPTGRDALIGFIPGLTKSGIQFTNHRILQDGEFVVLHNSFTNAQAFGADKIVTFDIYRMKDGKAVEHWDAITPVVEKTASGRTQVDGATEIADLDKTEANKALAVSLIQDVCRSADMRMMRARVAVAVSTLRLFVQRLSSRTGRPIRPYRRGWETDPNKSDGPLALLLGHLGPHLGHVELLGAFDQLVERAGGQRAGL